MTARDAILSAIRKNRPPGRHDLPDLPRFPVDEPGGTVETFARNLKRMGGSVLDIPPGGDPLAALRDRLATASIVCSVVPEVAGNRDPRAVGHPREMADVDIAIVRAVLGVAETGSVLFTEAQLQVNAVAYLAQHLIVLLDPAAIVPSLPDAYDRPEFRQASYAVFHTGPSATADIEGVLVLGAQGVRSLTVVLA